MSAGKKKTVQIKAQLAEMGSLKAIVNGFSPITREKFTAKYGKILDLLYTPVHLEAITSLVQYYDPPLRCFTFKDFQLAPTLEEFEHILGFPEKKEGPYRGIGKTVKPIDLGNVLELPDLVSNYKTSGLVHGISRVYLERKVQEFVKVQNWNAAFDVLALLVFGLILFPNLDNFIDTSAISVFWAFKVNEEGPVPALLADVYHTLHVRYSKRKGLMLCCIPLLYIWFASQVFKDISLVKEMDSHGWSQKMASLTEKSILWYVRKRVKDEVIVSCGRFPNVPLIGSKGCINYNPLLALRQLGYPMFEKPDEESLEEFVLHDMGAGNPVLLQNIIRAWEKVHIKGVELRKRIGQRKETYKQWIKERVELVKLPFILETSTQPEEVEPVPMAVDEVEELKAAIWKLKLENEDLHEKFCRTNAEKNNLKWELERRDAQLKATKEKADVEESQKKRVKKCLDQADGGLLSLKKSYSIKEASALILNYRDKEEIRKYAAVWSKLISLKVSTLVWRLWQNKIPTKDILPREG